MSEHPRALLAARGLRPKKGLGQHFLVDAGSARRIAALCAAGNLPAYEVGPGTGALTVALLECGLQVCAIEIDAEMVAILEARPDIAGATIVNEDAMTFDFAANVPPLWCACGNLPYNIATPLVLGWIESPAPPQRIVVMVQKDVADRFVAAPSTPAYGSLTLAVGFEMQVRRAFVLGPSAFYPRPNVESAVVVMERRAEPAVNVRDRIFFRQVVRAAFAYRRKTLANSLALALGIQRERTQRALVANGLDTEIRAEQLDLRAFAALADELVS